MVVKEAVDKAVVAAREACGLTDNRPVSPFDQALFGQIVAVEAIAHILGCKPEDIMQQYVTQTAETPADTN